LFSLYGKDIELIEDKVDELLIRQETVKDDLMFKLEELTSDLSHRIKILE
jgi:hypothetical protein